MTTFEQRVTQMPYRNVGKHLSIAILLAVGVFAVGCARDTAVDTLAEILIPDVPTVADPADWCDEHALPESFCTVCNPELLEPFQAAGDFCGEHGYPESVCPFCNPLTPPGPTAGHGDHGRVGDAADWCGEHALPESMCTVCNPGLIDGFRATGDWCGGHGFPESACPLCNPWSPPGSTGDGHAHGEHVGDLADWCDEHALPESMCTLCNPSLTEGFRDSGDWCGGHGFPESVCPFCNPMTPPSHDDGSYDHAPHSDEAADWCHEHELPESMCTRCDPSLTEGFQASGDWCNEHGYPESVCPFCSPQPHPEEGHNEHFALGTRIRFRDSALEAAAGIETTHAVAGALGIDVEAMARVDFNRNAMAEIHAPVPGIVREMLVDLGDQVAVDDALFTLESAHIGDLQARRRATSERVQAAEANLARQEELRQDGIASQRQIELANQELEAAEAELQSFDQSLRISGAARRGRTGRFSVHSPISGSVVRRDTLIGSFAGESDSLATVADTAVMWALLDIPEWDAASVRLGQRVEVRVDGVEARRFTGSITWIASEVDSRTRSVSARAEVQNPDGLLRAGQFARATVRVEAPRGAVTIPARAVQRLEDESVVFVRAAPGLYEPRMISLGRSNGDRVQVSGDLRNGEAVVTTGAYLLRTELSRDSIGAGCCEVGPPEEN